MLKKKSTYLLLCFVVSVLFFVYVHQQIEVRKMNKNQSIWNFQDLKNANRDKKRVATESEIKKYTQEQLALSEPVLSAYNSIRQMQMSALNEKELLNSLVFKTSYKDASLRFIKELEGYREKEPDVPNSLDLKEMKKNFSSFLYDAEAGNKFFNEALEQRIPYFLTTAEQNFLSGEMHLETYKKILQDVSSMYQTK